MGCAFQIQSPVLECFVYCEKFFVVYLIIEFCGNHGSRVEGDGVQVVVARRDLRKDSGNRVVGAISLYDYRVGWVKVSEDGSRGEGLFEVLKGFLALGTPFERGVLTRKAVHRYHDLRVVCYEPSVEVSEP